MNDGLHGLPGLNPPYGKPVGAPYVRTSGAGVYRWPKNARFLVCTLVGAGAGRNTNYDHGAGGGGETVNTAISVAALKAAGFTSLPWAVAAVAADNTAGSATMLGPVTAAGGGLGAVGPVGGAGGGFGGGGRTPGGVGVFGVGGGTLYGTGARRLDASTTFAATGWGGGGTIPSFGGNPALPGGPGGLVVEAFQ